MATVNPTANNTNLWKSVGEPVVTFFQDIFKATDLTTQQSKGVKEVTKFVMQILKLADVSSQTNAAATYTITFIEALELPQSISYWINQEFKKREETAVKIAAQANLLAIRVLVLIKALDKIGIDVLGKASELIGKIPVVGEAFGKLREVTGPYLTLDSVLGTVFLPFAALSLVDNSQTVVKESGKVAHENESIRFWAGGNLNEVRKALIKKQNKVDDTADADKRLIKQRRYDSFIAKDINRLGDDEVKAIAKIQHDKSICKRKISAITITKTVIGAISTVLKAAAAITALVALFVFGSPIVAATALTILALVATAFALSKVLYEGYQTKYQDQYKRQIAAAA